MKLFKSKQGFTLIELLVVIGILAVLAAIAIPSVAGLIDRANVSADTTNANEMTNALERFASEYELYKQDIASGAIEAGQTSGFDSVQGRVYNVIKVTTRAEIENIEKPDTAKAEDTTGIAIYRDTKYPVNAETTKAIVENYTKTSSSTFEPKQSDMHYWYSPDCGVVVYAEPNANKAALNGNIVSGMDAKGNELSEKTIWIDLTEAVALSNGSDEPSQEKGEYYTGATACATCSRGYGYAGDTCSVCRGKNFTGSPALLNEIPENSLIGDIYVCGDYKYVLQNNGWSASALDKNKEQYGALLGSFNGKSLISINGAFSNCSQMKTAPAIPTTVSDISNAFCNCSSLITAPTIPNSVVNMTSTFKGCTSLTGVITINASVTAIYQYSSCFNLVNFQSQCITLTGSASKLDDIGATGKNYCTECHGMCTDADYSELNPDNGTTPQKGESYTYGNYEYRYQQYYHIYSGTWMSSTTGGWGIRCVNNVADPGPILESINGEPITDMHGAFARNTNLSVAPTIPNTVKDMTKAFYYCTSLRNAPTIPNGVTNLTSTFQYCPITVAPAIPNSVTQMHGTFSDCDKLRTAPIIPSSVQNIATAFYGCTALTGTITINTNTTNYSQCFKGVNFELQNLTLQGSSSKLDLIGQTGTNY